MNLIIDRQRIEMTDRERDFFAAFFNARGAALSKDTIRDLVYGAPEDGGPYSQTVVVMVNRLKQKLAPTDFRIINHYGWGYSMTRLPEVIRVAA